MPAAGSAPPLRAGRSLVIFDLDGTLVDSRRDLAESTNEMLASYGAAPLQLDAVARMVGEGARLLVARALAAAGLDPSEPEALERFRSIYDRRLVDFTRPYDGIREVIAMTSERARLAVLTNKPESPSRRLIEAFDLAGHFSWLIGGDSGFPRKPDPSSVNHLMTQAGATPAATMIVGDSWTDAETARRAGVRLCIAGYGFGTARDGAPLTPLPGEFFAADPAGIVTALALLSE